MTRLSKQPILWGMVTLKILPYETYARDYEVASLAKQIQEETGRNDDTGVIAYADLVCYTDDISFNWHEDAPEEYRSLETWWEMVKNDASEGECYLFYIENVSNVVVGDWINAKTKAQSVWKPPEQKPDKELTKEEISDPN